MISIPIRYRDRQWKSAQNRKKYLRSQQRVIILLVPQKQFGQPVTIKLCATFNYCVSKYAIMIKKVLRIGTSKEFFQLQIAIFATQCNQNTNICMKVHRLVSKYQCNKKRGHSIPNYRLLLMQCDRRLNFALIKKMNKKRSNEKKGFEIKCEPRQIDQTM